MMAAEKFPTRCEICRENMHGWFILLLEMIDSDRIFTLKKYERLTNSPGVHGDANVSTKTIKNTSKSTLVDFVLENAIWSRVFNFGSNVSPFGQVPHLNCFKCLEMFMRYCLVQFKDVHVFRFVINYFNRTQEVTVFQS